MKTMLKKWTEKLPKRNGKKGFTLIEMIVVVAIIAILIALLVPNVMKFIGTANTSAANANAKTIFVATQTYIADLYSHGISIGDVDKGDLEATEFNHGSMLLKEYLSGDAATGTIQIRVKNGACVGVTWQKKTGDSTVGRYPTGFTFAGS